MLRKLFAGLALSVALTGAAQSAESIRIAGSLRPGSMMEGIIRTFIDNFNEQAGPDYKLEYQFVGNDQEMTQQIIRGRLEIGTTGLAGAAVSVPPSAVLSMPYLWDNDAQRRWGIDNVVRPVLEGIYRENGLVIIGLGDAGWSNVFCKETCDTPQEVEGRRFRMPPAASARAFWEKLDVNGVQLSLPDFFTGLEQGMVEGGDLPLTFFVTTPAAHFAKRYVITRQYHHEQAFFVNRRFYEALPPRIQDLLKSAMPSTEEMRRRQDEDEALQMQRFVETGGAIVPLSDEERAAWAQKVGNVHEDLLASLPGRSRELYDAVQEARKRYDAGQ